MFKKDILQAELSNLASQAHGAAMSADRIEHQLECISTRGFLSSAEHELSNERKDIEMMISRYSKMLEAVIRLEEAVQ